MQNDNISKLYLIAFLLSSLLMLATGKAFPLSQADSLITIAAVGDVMMGTSFPPDSSCTPPDTTRYLPPDGGKYLFNAVKNELKSADITFCNLEGGLLDGGIPRKECSNPQHCYLFRTPTAYVNNLVAAGFNLVSLANNHSRDFFGGIDTTMSVLDRVGIAHSGKLGDIAVMKKRDLTVAMIAFAPYDGLYDLLDPQFAAWRIAKLNRQYDIVIVSFHGGGEGSKHIHVPDSMEVYFGEERGHLRQFTHQMIEAGADLLLGHGPHVPRGIEIYQNRLIAYSLGNFCTYERFNLKGYNGLTFILKVSLNRRGEFQGGQVIPCKQIDPGIPLPDPEKKVIQLLRWLSKKDFPQTAAQIDPQGHISRPVIRKITEKSDH